MATFTAPCVAVGSVCNAKSMHRTGPFIHQPSRCAQILAGVVEERGIERMLHGNAVACGVASFVVRTGNTFLGTSAQLFVQDIVHIWVLTVRLLHAVLLSESDAAAWPVC